jgi:glycosyltransferase involved in cell wall biosynthesis
MYILIISAVFPPEPVVSAKLSFDIASAVIKKEEVVVISPKPTRPYGFKFNFNPSEFDFKHIQLDSYTCPKYSLIGRIRESYDFGILCYKFINKNYKDIKLIYANTWPLIAQYFTVKAAQKNNIPVIIHVQDIYPESLTNKIPAFRLFINFLLLPIDKYVLRYATKIIAISDKMKNYLISTRKVEKEKIAIVPNWQNENLFLQHNAQNKSKTIDENIFTFMYLGNIGPVADIDMLIEAFNKAMIKGCRLIIAGSGSMKESLERKVEEKKYQNIEFWSVPDGKVPEIQNYADTMILTLKKGSASSSIPSKLPAYMFSAKPVIACVDSESDTANTIMHGNCGWIVHPENIDDLTAIMLKVVSIPKEELHRYGLNGSVYALENFSRSKNLLKLINIINYYAVK